MKNLRLTLLAAAIVLMAAACAPAEPDKTAMQKKYASEAECRKEWTTPGDCVGRKDTSSNGPGLLFYGPLFYMWGAVMHNNGSMAYNQRVPSTGYYKAPAGLQSTMANRTNFSNSPSYKAAAASRASAAASNSTRGGFGSSAGSRSSGG